MNYTEARAAYEHVSRDLIGLRAQKREADALLGKIKAIGLMSDEVAAGLNEKARSALLLDWLEEHEHYQIALSESEDLAVVIAYAEVDLSLARYDIQYVIATASVIPEPIASVPEYNGPPLPGFEEA